MSPESVTASTPPHPWSSDQYLKPILQEDPLLQLDFESIGGGGGGPGGVSGGPDGASGGPDGASEGASGGLGVSRGASGGVGSGNSESLLKPKQVGGSNSESMLKAKQVAFFLSKVLELFCCAG